MVKELIVTCCHEIYSLISTIKEREILWYILVDINQSTLTTDKR